MFLGVYEVERLGNTLGVRSLSSYLTFSLNNPLQSKDIVKFAQFTKKHIQL